MFIQFEGKNRRKMDTILLFLYLNEEGGLYVKLINFIHYRTVGLVCLCN
jgi:hypothetical protein